MVELKLTNKNNNLENLTVLERQNYVPLYKTLYDNCTINTKIVHDKTIQKILEKKSYSDYVVELKNNKVVDCFIKLSPLIEPLKYSIGKYKNINIKTLPKPSKISELSEMDDVNNLAYIDSFFYYLTSILLNKYNFVHGIDFYDTFLGISNKFKYNISEEIDTLISNSYFKENHNKLFNIDNSDLFQDKPKLNIEESVSLDDFVELTQEENKESSNDDVEILYNNESTINEITSDIDSSSEYSNSDCETDSEYSDSNSEDESESNYDSEDSEYSDIDEDEIYLTINNFPCQFICLEKLTDTLDSLIVDDNISVAEWKSALFQVIMILITYQKVFDLTHNDLHSNNIMWIETKERFLYYKFDDKYYKVPTYNKIYKIIDFGRSIYKFKDTTYFSNSFSKEGDAASQYNCEPYYNDKKPKVYPNKSFDISRLACSLFDYFYDDVNDTRNKCDIAKIVLKWCMDDNNKNILYKKNNTERYPDFKLYKMISRTVHHLEPHKLLNEAIFKKFSVFEKQIKKAKLMNIDEIPKLYK